VNEIAFVFPSSVDVQLLEFAASLPFDKCEIFLELFGDSSGRPVANWICVNPLGSFIYEEEIVNRLGFDRFCEGATNVGVDGFKFPFCFRLR
jgi:hypothetical protein